MDIKEILVSAILPAIKVVGKAQLKDVLAKIKTNNTPEVYENTLKSVHASFSLLEEVTVKTKTKIDDGIVTLVLEAVSEMAEEDGIVL